MPCARPKCPVLCLVPDEPLGGLTLPKGIVSAIETVDWEAITHNPKRS
jgi:hypothetical protein